MNRTDSPEDWERKSPATLIWVTAVHSHCRRINNPTPAARAQREPRGPWACVWQVHLWEDGAGSGLVLRRAGQGWLRGSSRHLAPSRLLRQGRVVHHRSAIGIEERLTWGETANTSSCTIWAGRKQAHVLRAGKMSTIIKFKNKGSHTGLHDRFMPNAKILTAMTTCR